MGGVFSKKRNQNGEGGLARGYSYQTVDGQRVFMHRAIVEKILGRNLPNTVIVHHVDEDITNNAPSNLVVCQDASYHRLLHYRMRALDESGDANNRRCIFCKQWGSPETMKHNKAQYAHYHRECRAKARRKSL